MFSVAVTFNWNVAHDSNCFESQFNLYQQKQPFSIKQSPWVVTSPLLPPTLLTPKACHQLSSTPLPRERTSLITTRLKYLRTLPFLRFKYLIQHHLMKGNFKILRVDFVKTFKEKKTQEASFASDEKSQGGSNLTNQFFLNMLWCIDHIIGNTDLTVKPCFHAIMIAEIMTTRALGSWYFRFCALVVQFTGATQAKQKFLLYGSDATLALLTLACVQE